jgi:hypothetical protein
MLPMKEPRVGQTGLIEAGGRLQGDPANPQSSCRQRFTIPPEHSGGSEFHFGSIEFDFRSTPGAFYTIFAPRVNEGVDVPGPGTLELRSIEIYALD